MDTFATRFAALDRLGLNQVQAAKRLGATKNHVWQLLHGQRVPSLDSTYQIAIKLGIDPHSLDERLASTRKGRRP